MRTVEIIFSIALLVFSAAKAANAGCDNTMVGLPNFCWTNQQDCTSSQECHNSECYPCDGFGPHVRAGLCVDKNISDCQGVIYAFCDEYSCQSYP